MPLVSSQTHPSAVGLHPRSACPALGGAHERMQDARWATVAQWYERHREEVFRYVFRRVPRREEAEDITAQVFAAAYEALPRFREECPPHLWLLGIARRQTALALRRRAARRETLASELPDESGADPIWQALAAVEGPEAAAMRAEARRVVRDLLGQLNADQREAVLLQYVERLTIAEIAVVMGRSPAAVNSLLQRARAALYRRGRSYFAAPDEGERR
jgi:RNA polymerase sigma-70 factor, ECF subfamily